MNENYGRKIAIELELKYSQVSATAELLEQGATVPFIARYRKEATGTLDEVEITAIRDRLEQLEELDKRREAILASLTERDLLTEELQEKILSAETMAQLEDIYLPFRPKRRTRATIAREKGLEPLANTLFEQGSIDPQEEALKYINPEKEVTTAEEALSGARDILAEQISENETARGRMRQLFAEKASMSSSVVKGKEEEGIKFKDYYDWDEPIQTAPSHRILAMFRGEKEGFLKLKVLPLEEEAVNLLLDQFILADNQAAQQVEMAVDDGYKRLLSSSMETEIRKELKKSADLEAIQVFSRNLRELLLAPPLGQKNTLALDPGFRTGCKLVCLDRQGQLMHHETIYPHNGDNRAREAAETIRILCKNLEIEAIAIGNGTASRETENFVKGIGLPHSIPIIMVNESGASIYSASETAREEFPNEDITVRGSVSIGRRLMDPLAELVKIDPKSIGVGQYQHDVDQSLLKKGLDDIVVSCVNRVGVDLNTASKRLLTYVSGLGPQLAQNVVNYRNEKGAFGSRTDLKKVKGLGPKAFQQAAGFLRIRNGKNPLDASAVHPESYHIVDKMARDLGCNVTDLMKQETLRKQIKLDKYIEEKVGLPTLQDIMEELSKPGRDPREQFEPVQFAEGIEKIEDLSAGMKLPGIITNVTAFGAFVDIGVHQDGLVHVSQLSNRFVRDPSEVVKVNQKVLVTVLDVDVERKRISLSMK